MADRTDQMFRAFSDRTRLRILSILRGGECCVGNVVDILGIEQPKASRHLAYLRNAGLVRSRRSALWTYYSLAPAVGEFHGKLLECLACCFSEVPQLLEDQAKAERIRGAGGCCPAEEEAVTESLTPGACCEDVLSSPDGSS